MKQIVTTSLDQDRFHRLLALKDVKDDMVHKIVFWTRMGYAFKSRTRRLSPGACSCTPSQLGTCFQEPLQLHSTLHCRHHDKIPVPSHRDEPLRERNVF